MTTEEATIEGPNWLKELEARRERRLKVKLGHESGAGSPCLNCKDDCPGLDLHFWRKICKNCKCGKESHDVQDDDIYGWAEFQLLGSKPTKSKKIVLPGKKEEIELEWVPKGQNEVVDNFLKDLPPELLPVKGSAAAQERKQMLQKQIPLHDIDPTLCHALTEEEVEKMNDYINHIKEKSVGVGKIIQLQIPVNSKIMGNRITGQMAQNESHLVVHYPNPIGSQNLTGQLTGQSSNLIGQAQNFNQQSNFFNQSQPNLEDLQRNLQNLNLYYRQLEDIPTNFLREVQFGMRDIIYDQNLNYDPKIIDSAILEQRFDPNLNCIILRGKKDESAVETKKQLPRLNNFNLYNKPLSEIPQNVLQHVQFGWRDIEFDTNVLHDPLELRNHGLETGFCKKKKLLVLKALNGLNPKVEEKEPLCIGDIENLYPVIKNVYPDVKMFYPNLNNNPSSNVTTSNYDPRSMDPNLIAFDPDSLKPIVDVNNPLNLPRYSDFVKNALSKIDPLSTASSLLDYSPDDVLTPLNQLKIDQNLPPPRPNLPNNYPNVNLSTNVNPSHLPSTYENIQNPTTVNIGSIQDITYPSQNVKTAVNVKNDNSPSEPNLDTSLSKINCQKCHKCKKHFDDTSFAITLDRNDTLWHIDCFKCFGCNQNLADMIYFYDKESDQIYCGRDYAKIRGFHRCSACDELIFVKEYCLAEDRTFHVKHFCCFDCDTPLAGQNYVIDDNSQPICLPCYEKFNSERCNTCKKAIQAYEQGAKLQDVHFHANDDCFCCKMCRKPLLGGKLMFKNKNLYCSGDCFKADQ